MRRAVEAAIAAAAAVLDDGGGSGTGVVVDAVVGGDDVAGVVAVPLHPLLHAAALRRAAVVVPAQVRMHKLYQHRVINRHISFLCSFCFVLFCEDSFLCFLSFVLGI